jgi:ubiquinol-cytochrome c reductase cytochrome c1 subunit
MRTEFLVLIAALLATPAHAASGGGHVERANNDVSNKASLQRGARNFVNYCLGCHSAKYVRYNRLALDIDISEQQLIENLMFTGERPHDTITNSIHPDDANRAFGVVPPDLSLVARNRGPDYVYSFLKSFYADPTKATGSNNLVLPGTAMPHVLWELQGIQNAVWEGQVDAQGNASKHFKEFELVTPGRMDPHEFDSFVRDTVNFLDYAAEPVQLKRKSLGYRVIAFLVFFTLLAWALKKEFWKDVK